MAAHPPRGTIEVICGCMFAGKTVELLRRLRAGSEGQVRAFKHRRDDRYSETDIVSHNGDRFPARLVTGTGEILQHVQGRETLIGIDEGHFYDASLPDVCRQLAAGGAEVVVTTLDPDSWGRPFAHIEQLKAVADRVTKMWAVCAVCGQPADCNQRTTPIQDGNIVGGPEAFEPRCRAHWTAPPEPHIA